MKRMINSLYLKARCGMENFKKSEKGDTNFISILIILAIAMVVASVFFVFKDTIVEWVRSIMTAFEGEMKQNVVE